MDGTERPDERPGAGEGGEEAPIRIAAGAGGLEIHGELDMATAEQFAKHLAAAPERGELVLDFAGVTFMDSSGLRILLETAQARGASDPLVIVNPPRQVQRVLDISIPGGTPGLEVRR